MSLVMEWFMKQAFDVLGVHHSKTVVALRAH